MNCCKVKRSKGLSNRVSVIIRTCKYRMKFGASFKFFWFYFVSLFVWLYVSYASIYFSMLHILIVMYVPFCLFRFIVSFCVLFVCKCVLYCRQQVATQFQVTDIS